LNEVLKELRYKKIKDKKNKIFLHSSNSSNKVKKIFKPNIIQTGLTRRGMSGIVRVRL